MKIIIQSVLFSVLIIIGGCKTDSGNEVGDKDSTGGIAADAMDGHYPAWSKNANMYEVNIRQFTPEGSFAAFESHIPRLKEMGVDILWLMPVYPISHTKKKGSLGSYYAVSDYSKVNPEFGSIDDFRKMVQTVHANEMKVILDFVPNHTGWDHVWLSEHPDYYTKDKDGNVVDPIDPSTGKSWGWTDVADLNFDNPEMRQAMIDDMLYWIEEEDIDGFRMDVAHGVPVSFWDEVSTALTQAKPDIFMLAESEVPALRNNKYFQSDYGWGFHHLLNDIAKGEKGPKDVQEWYVSNRETYQTGWHIHFTSNHDENSWAGTTMERMGPAHEALAALAYTLDGMPLVYGGQEEPLSKRLEFFEKDDIGFGDYQKVKWYKSILDLKHNNQAIWNGEFGGKVEFLKVDENVLAFKREKNGAEVYSILNLSATPTNLQLEQDLVGFTDVIENTKINFPKGQKIDLDSWSYKLFSKS